MLYVIIILVSMALIVTINLLFSPGAPERYALSLCLSTLLGTISVIAWDGLQAFLIRRLPERWFSADKERFCVGKRERLIYRRLGINHWKDLIPELGGFTGFHKSEFRSPNDPDYLARFLLESNYGLLIHISNALLGIAIVTLPWCSDLAVALPIAAVNFVLNLLPAAILRFHTAPLRSIYLHKRAKRSGAS